MADRPFIGFEPDPEIARAVEAERKRLAATRDEGAFVGKAEAVRSLIAQAAAAAKEKVDA